MYTKGVENDYGIDDEQMSSNHSSTSATSGFEESRMFSLSTPSSQTLDVLGSKNPTDMLVYLARQREQYIKNVDEAMKLIKASKEENERGCTCSNHKIDNNASIAFLMKELEEVKVESMEKNRIIEDSGRQISVLQEREEKRGQSQFYVFKEWEDKMRVVERKNRKLEADLADSRSKNQKEIMALKKKITAMEVENDGLSFQVSDAETKLEEEKKKARKLVEALNSLQVQQLNHPSTTYVRKGSEVGKAARKARKRQEYGTSGRKGAANLMEQAHEEYKD